MGTEEDKGKQKQTNTIHKKKEVANMAVLAQNIRMSFELDSKKVDDFFKKSDKTAFARAIARASSHKSDKEKSGHKKCTNSDGK
ncbi:MAG: hypothetical protein AB7C89_08805 [Intestinibacillus sp.]